MTNEFSKNILDNYFTSDINISSLLQFKDSILKEDFPAQLSNCRKSFFPDFPQEEETCISAYMIPALIKFFCVKLSQIDDNYISYSHFINHLIYTLGIDDINENTKKKLVDNLKTQFSSNPLLAISYINKLVGKYYPISKVPRNIEKYYYAFYEIDYILTKRQNRTSENETEKTVELEKQKFFSEIAKWGKQRIEKSLGTKISDEDFDKLKKCHGYAKGFIRSFEYTDTNAINDKRSPFYKNNIEPFRKYAYVIYNYVNYYTEGFQRYIALFRLEAEYNCDTISHIVTNNTSPMIHSINQQSMVKGRYLYFFRSYAVLTLMDMAVRQTSTNTLSYQDYLKKLIDFFCKLANHSNIFNAFIPDNFSFPQWFLYKPLTSNIRKFFNTKEFWNQPNMKQHTLEIILCAHFGNIDEEMISKYRLLMNQYRESQCEKCPCSKCPYKYINEKFESMIRKPIMCSSYFYYLLTFIDKYKATLPVNDIGSPEKLYEEIKPYFQGDETGKKASETKINGYKEHFFAYILKYIMPHPSYNYNEFIFVQNTISNYNLETSRVITMISEESYHAIFKTLTKEEQENYLRKTKYINDN